MSNYVNGVKMGFALQAYADEYAKQLEQEKREREESERKQCVKFSNLREECYDDYDDEDDFDKISFDVNEGFNMNIYVDGKFAFGPIEGGCTVTIE